MLALLAGQLLVAGQAFAMPVCHAQTGDGTRVEHAHHHANANNTSPVPDQPMDCHCPQGQHCGHSSVALTGPLSSAAHGLDTTTYHPLPVRATALGYRQALDRPPPRA